MPRPIVRPTIPGLTPALALTAVLSVAACGSKSSDGDGGDSPKYPKETGSEAPSAEPAVTPVAVAPDDDSGVLFDSKEPFSKSSFSCNRSGYGYAMDDSLNKIAVCCIVLDPATIADGSAKFVTRASDRITIAPTQCDATVISGSLGAISQPVDFDLSSQKYVQIGDYSLDGISDGNGPVKLMGSKDLDTRLVGAEPLRMYGQFDVSNIHAIGTTFEYSAKDAANFNSLSMKNVTIEGFKGENGGLYMTSKYATNAGTTGMTLKFEQVKVVADAANPVLLENYPFDTAGIEIIAGKQFAPHIGLRGEYTSATGKVAEKRYPIVAKMTLLAGSNLTVGPGVKLKIASGDFAFHGLEVSGVATPAKLNLEGSADERIQITSLQDDTIGGDSNGDGTITQGDLVLLNKDGAECDVTIHYADLFGVAMESNSQGGSTLTLGNVTLRAAQSGTYHVSPISLYWVGYNYRKSKLILDAAVEAWQPLETYNDEGRTMMKSAIMFGAYTDGYNGSNASESVQGVDFLTVHNTSTSPNKVTQDVRVFDTTIDGCKLVVDSSLQLTAATKQWTFYPDTHGLMTQCK